MDQMASKLRSIESWPFGALSRRWQFRLPDPRSHRRRARSSMVAARL